MSQKETMFIEMKDQTLININNIKEIGISIHLPDPGDKYKFINPYWVYAITDNTFHNHILDEFKTSEEAYDYLQKIKNKLQTEKKILNI